MTCAVEPRHLVGQRRLVLGAAPELAERQRHGLDVVLSGIAHQANQRIIANTAERLGLTPEQVVINIEKYGNTTGATIPLATNDALLDGRLKRGDLVLFAAVGAGFTTGASLWRWSI